MVDAFEVPFCARAGGGSSFTRDYVHKWEARLMWGLEMWGAGIEIQGCWYCLFSCASVIIVFQL